MSPLSPYANPAVREKVGLELDLYCRTHKLKGERCSVCEERLNAIMMVVDHEIERLHTMMDGIDSALLSARAERDEISDLLEDVLADLNVTKLQLSHYEKDPLNGG